MKGLKSGNDTINKENSNDDNKNKMNNDKGNDFGSRVLQNENNDDCGNGSRDDVGGETPLHSHPLRLSNLLAKHHTVHHAQHFSY